MSFRRGKSRCQTSASGDEVETGSTESGAEDGDDADTLRELAAGGRGEWGFDGDWGEGRDRLWLRDEGGEAVDDLSELGAGR
ncbi:MAG: hypothetical protein M9935_06385 [Kiritimatiellae bacterium]|nr:hypothetical protein [Kiritimatiellia bacterium]